MHGTPIDTTGASLLTTTIKPGDIVQQAEGGQMMVVTEIGSPVRVRCIWADDGTYLSDAFHPKTLVKVDADVAHVLGLGDREQ